MTEHTGHKIRILLEADEEFRRLEREWKSSGDREALVKLHAELLRRKSVREADKLVVREATANQTRIVKALSKLTPKIPNLLYGAGTTTQPRHGSQQFHTQQSSAYISVDTATSSRASIGLLTDIEHGLIRVQLSIVHREPSRHHLVNWEARQIQAALEKVIGSGWAYSYSGMHRWMRQGVSRDRLNVR